MKSPSIVAFLGSAVLVPFLVLAPGCRKGELSAGPRPVVGVKIYEAAPPFEGLFSKWRELGINTLFVSEALLTNGDFRTQARANGLTLFLIYPVYPESRGYQGRPADRGHHLGRDAGPR